ncbi:MAG: SusD/RagB family nutrient-binding outer membrane lipoprotein [Flavobacteriales bacterium]
MKKLIISFLFATILFSCKLDEVNENPNVPTDVSVSLLLPTAQKGLADAIGGRFFRYTAIASQQLSGRDNQELLMENYNPDELFIGYPWEDFYTGPMVNCRIIIDKAEAEGANAYAGIAQILLANSIGIITDAWGDAPFIEAMQGGDNLYPRYDSQQEIYLQIISLLNDAIFDLEQPSTIVPSSDDLIYGGDLNKWKRAAHALLARTYIHLTNVRTDASARALEELSDGFTNFNEDLAYRYLGNAADANPIYNFFVATAYAVVDPQYISVLGAADPRFSRFVDIIPFTGGQSKVGAFQGSANSPIKLMSYVEQKFIESEALLRTSNTAGAQDALRQAVQASLDETEEFLMIDIPDGQENSTVNALVLTGDFEADLNIIMREKFSALFTQPECWTDWRRTGYPVLTPNPDGNSAANPGGQIPRRLIYPQTERLLNPNFPGVLTMDVKMWMEGS